MLFNDRSIRASDVDEPSGGLRNWDGDDLDVFIQRFQQREGVIGDRSTATKDDDTPKLTCYKFVTIFPCAYL